jgi:hypothetical protein
VGLLAGYPPNPAAAIFSATISIGLRTDRARADAAIERAVEAFWSPVMARRNVQPTRARSHLLPRT